MANYAFSWDLHNRYMYHDAYSIEVLPTIVNSLFDSEISSESSTIDSYSIHSTLKLMSGMIDVAAVLDTVCNYGTNNPTLLLRLFLRPGRAFPSHSSLQSCQEK